MAPADIPKQWQEARANRRMQFKVGNYRDGSWESNIRLLTGTIKVFFCLMAAWLNEVRCPGGRPSVSTNYITIEANVFCIEMTTVHVIRKHRIKLAVSQRVPLG